MHYGIRAVIFYAPPWSPADVTKKHAAVISAHIPEVITTPLIAKLHHINVSIASRIVG
jgi:hypothetical protein